MTEPLPEKSCERCGRRFGCGADRGACWCFATETDKAALERIAAIYEDCLCGTCLRELSGPVGPATKK